MLFSLTDRQTDRWGKFYPKKVIKIGGVELSSQINHVTKFIQKSYPKNLSKITSIILPYFIDDKQLL